MPWFCYSIHKDKSYYAWLSPWRNGRSIFPAKNLTPCNQEFGMIVPVSSGDGMPAYPSGFG